MQSLEDYKNSLAAPELREPRRKVCQLLATELANCGGCLWAFGMATTEMRRACSLVIQFGGSLATGSVKLGEQENWYAALALVRQLIEVEYLLRLFIQDSDEAIRWLKASPKELRSSYTPAAIRKRVDGLRQEHYRAHCETGGHPNPRAHSLLPERVFEHDLPPFGNYEIFWVDLAQHLRGLWRDVASIPGVYPSENLNVIAKYKDAVDQAIAEWQAVDPLSRT